MVKIYLAGGMRSNWRDRVKSSFPSAVYLDPCEHGLSDPSHYTPWDLVAIRQSDIVFVYFESTNPSGYGLSLESGYAHALNKPIILVDEHPDDPRLGMLRSVSDIVTTSFSDGINYLSTFSEIFKC